MLERFLGFWGSFSYKKFSYKKKRVCSWIFSKHFRNNFLADNCGRPVSYIIFIILRNSPLQKKVFLKISQSLQENICARVSFLIKLKAWGLHMWLWHKCFSVNFMKFLRTSTVAASVFWRFPCRQQSLPSSKLV